MIGAGWVSSGKLCPRILSVHYYLLVPTFPVLIAMRVYLKGTVTPGICARHLDRLPS